VIYSCEKVDPPIRKPTPYICRVHSTMFSVFARRAVLTAIRASAPVNVALRSSILSARTFTSSRTVFIAEPVKNQKVAKLTKAGLPRAKPGPKPKRVVGDKKSKKAGAKAKSATKNKPAARKVAPKKNVTVTLRSSSWCLFIRKTIYFMFLIQAL
jgi:hypothetical protein